MSLKGNYQEKQKALRVEAQRLQEKLDEALLGQRKLEEEVLVLREESASLEMSGAEAAQSKSALGTIQLKYSVEVSDLTAEIKVKDRSLSEMRSKRIAMVRKTVALHLYMKQFNFHLIQTLLTVTSIIVANSYAIMIVIIAIIVIITSDVLEHKWRASLKTILFLYE